MRDLLQLQNSKKGQAAMEFLMTYGWALLVVLVAIGALAFFGVLNPGQFLPDQCTFFSGVSCLNYFASVTAGTITFDVQNGLGYIMDDATITLSINGADRGAAAGGTSCTATFDLNDGATRNCDYTLTEGATQKVRGTFAVSWKDEAGNSRTRNGQLALTVEA